jgi:hypothetical protein
MSLLLFFQQAVGVNATGDVTFGAMTGAGTATVEVAAQAATSFGALTGSGTATVETHAAGAVTFGAMTGSGSAVVSGETGPYKSTNVQVGSGYSDVQKQVVRTSGNRVYIVATNCDAYPCTSLTQRVSVWRADQIGIPSAFTKQDSANEPSGAGACAVAVDSSDNLHIIWHDRNSSDAIRYAVFNTSTNLWGTAEAVDSDLATPPDSGQGDMLLAISLDASNVPHVVYLESDGTRRRAAYRNRVGGTWSTTFYYDDNTYSGNFRAWQPNIIHDQNERVVVAWIVGTFNDTADGTVYVRTRETNGTWNAGVQVSATSGALTGIDNSTSMLVTADNRYHITYMNASTTPSQKFIRYRYSDNGGTSWSANDPGPQATHNPSLGPNGVGGIRIYGHGTPDAGNHGENVYFFSGAGGAAAWGSWTLWVTGTNYDSSVSTRWSRYNFTNVGYLDTIYWNDAYPNVLFYGGEHVAQAAGAASLGSLTGNASASVEVAGQGTVTFGAMTGTGTATTSSEINAVGDITFGAMTGSAEATVLVEADGSVVLEQMTGNGAAAVEVVASGAVTLGSMTAAGTAAVEVAAAGDITFGTMVGEGEGFVGDPPRLVEGNVTLGELTSTGTGTVETHAAASVQFDAMIAQAAGAVAIVAEGQVTFGAMVGSGTLLNGDAQFVETEDVYRVPSRRDSFKTWGRR